MDTKKISISSDVIFYISFGATLIGIGIGTYLKDSMQVLAPLGVGVVTTIFWYVIKFHESNKRLLNEKRILTQHLDDQKAKTIRYKSFAEAVISGQEQEKKRLALELHDDTIQRLIIIGHTIQLLKLDANTPSLNTEIHKVQTLVDDSIQSIRLFIKQLRPSYLEKLGLIPSLRELVVQISENTQTPIVFDFETTGTPYRIEAEVELSLYRIAQSALNNVIRHSEATKASLHLAFNPDSIVLSITDDGHGFSIPDDGQLLKNAHFGLMGMQERADLIGARFSIETSPGKGTAIIIEVATAPDDDTEQDSNNTLS